MDVDILKNFLRSSRNYDFGFGFSVTVFVILSESRELLKFIVSIFLFEIIHQVE